MNKRKIILWLVTVLMIGVVGCGKKDNLTEVEEIVKNKEISKSEMANFDSDVNVQNESNNESMPEYKKKIYDTLQIEGKFYNFKIIKDIHVEQQVYWNIQVYNKKGELLQIISDDILDDYIMYPEPDINELVSEKDINFDGFQDILIYTGENGQHGEQCFLGFIWNKEDSNFLLNESFWTIFNPKIDEKNNIILSTEIITSSIIAWELYQYNNGEYILIGVLTRTTQNNMEVWEDKRIINGEWKIINNILQYEDYCNDGYWNLASDKWY